MISFILRYIAVVIKENVLVDPVDFPEDVDPRQLTDVELNRFCLSRISFVSLKIPVTF